MDNLVSKRRHENPATRRPPPTQPNRENVLKFEFNASFIFILSVKNVLMSSSKGNATARHDACHRPVTQIKSATKILPEHDLVRKRK